MTAGEEVPADRRLMGLALALGRRNLGRTWPNPSVGAVVVAPDGRIVGIGATAPGGRPHAEPLALAAAGEAAGGATLYVSLEPCSHHGRTPPCAEAIVESGIARLVTATEDPDPRVAGRGHARVRAAGITVATGFCAAEARRDHRGHVTRVRHGRPAVTLKIARTADGFAAAGAEPRLLITGEGANARTHLLRAHADAVMIGVSTALADDPRLDVRLPGLEDRAPVRIVLDSRLRLVLGTRLAETARERPTWIVCTEAADPEAESRLAAAGVNILRVPAGPDARVDLAAALRELGSRGLTQILCEGGPQLADSLADAGLADEIVLVTNARPLGAPGVPAVGPALAAAIARAHSLYDERVGDDRIEVLERPLPCSPAS